MDTVQAIVTTTAALLFVASVA
eukprot:SAG11_NODE_33118_length_279_cov_0.577778_1_plen_21_part_10